MLIAHIGRCCKTSGSQKHDNLDESQPSLADETNESKETINENPWRLIRWL